MPQRLHKLLTKPVNAGTTGAFVCLFFFVVKIESSSGKTAAVQVAVGPVILHLILKCSRQTATVAL